MPSKTRPYEQFGPYILFKKLEADALGDLWRAGRIDDRHLGPVVALRRLTGGNREAFAQNAAEAHAVVLLLNGTSFAKDQVIDVADGIPCVAVDYGGGRSLRHIIDRARGGGGVTPNPVPIDQAILVAEKVALSLATIADLRYSGNRLMHGALIPHFVWITDDGDTRVAGQQLGKSLIASLKDVKVASAIGRYFSPEYQHSGEPTPGSEVYAMGAIFFLLVTGNEPPDAAHVSAFSQTIRAAKMANGQPVPDDIRSVLEKSLVIDPARRFASIGDMKQALSALAHGGKYSATTFNLAFYLSNLLKKEMESEAIDREKESKVNVAPYLEHQLEISAPIPIAPKPARSKAPLFVAAAILLALIAAGGFFAMRMSSANAAPQIASATRKQSAPPALPPVVPQPIVATASAAQSTTVDPAAEKKAFEAAVKQKLQAEMLKMQGQFDKQLQTQKSKNAPVPSMPPLLTASAAPQRTETMDDHSQSAAAFDERRVAARTETVAAQVPLPQPVTQTQPSAPQPAAIQAASSVREGDVVTFDDLDQRPVLTSKPRLVYPAMAMRQRVQSSVILTVLVSENGEVMDAKVLRGDERFGFNEAAIRAMKGARYQPAVKDGKRVKTWIPQPIDFKLQ